VTSTSGPAAEGGRRPAGDVPGPEGLWDESWDDADEVEMDGNGPVTTGDRMSQALASSRLRLGAGVTAALGTGLLLGALLFGGETPPLASPQAPAGQRASDPAAGGDAAAGDPAAGDPAAGDPAAGDPAAGESVAGDPAATASATGTSAPRGSAPGDAVTVAVAPAPVSIAVPALGLDQALIELGVTEERTLEVPEDWMDIGWWATGPAPGEPGGAVIAGHVNGDGKPAVFAELPSLERGAEVVVTRADGSAATYIVRSKEQFAKDDFPNERMYTFEGPSFLHLVTCGGSFDTRSGHYDDNIVIFAELVGVTAA